MAAFSSWSGRWGRRRRAVQLGFTALFALSPVLDLLRFDFTTNRLHAFGREIWLDEWALLWLALMFGMWVIGAATLVFGRVWCAWACPQTVFTELAHDLEGVARRVAKRLPPPARPAATRAVGLALVAAMSLAAAILAMGYFAPLPVVVGRLARFELGPWVGAVTAFVALLTFLDFAFLRERFCISVCPYGILQAVLEDGKSLHVAFQPEGCISCRACEKVCPMEIDIRKGSFQIECTRCGGCIDVCDRVLAPKGKSGLLAFRFGLEAGRWDLKRWLVTFATAAFGIAFVVVLATRREVTFALTPLYGQEGPAAAASGPPEARFLLKASNRGRAPLRLSVAASGLPEGSRIDGLGEGTVPAGEERKFTLVVRLGDAAPTAEATTIPFVLQVGGAGEARTFDAVFWAAGRRSS